MYFFLNKWKLILISFQCGGFHGPDDGFTPSATEGESASLLWGYSSDLQAGVENFRQAGSSALLQGAGVL